MLSTLPDDIWMIILEFVIPAPRKLLDWIDPNKIVWYNLSFPDYGKIDWSVLSEQDNALCQIRLNNKEVFLTLLDSLIEYHRIESVLYLNSQNTPNWYQLSANHKSIEMLRANPDKINWDRLSLNTAAMDLLQANQEKIDWNRFSWNPEIFESNPKLFKLHKEEFLEELKKICN